jgi:hypothetical protein
MIENIKGSEKWDPSVIALGKIIIGFGLAGIVLWLSPYTLTDLFMVFGIPLIIIASLLAAVGLVGSGFMEMINSKTIGEKVQQYVKEQVEETEQALQ